MQMRLLLFLLSLALLIGIPVVLAQAAGGGIEAAAHGYGTAAAP
jgi:hypothetical protein